MPTLPATDSEIRTRIREFIQANFLLGQAGSGFKDSDSFLDSGIVDSTGVLEIVEFLQDSYDLTQSRPVASLPILPSLGMRLQW